MSTPKIIRPDGWLYHLSHTDLDGYGAQYMVGQTGQRCHFFNADYREIGNALDEIVGRIAKAGEPAGLLITDLNLSLDQAEQLDRRIRRMKVPVELQLLDHHATGADCAEAFDWYYLDTERCASLLAFEAVADQLDEPVRERMRKRAAFIDVGDRWLRDHADFRRAIYLIGLVMQDDHLAPPLKDLKRAYRFHLMEAFFRSHEAGESLETFERDLFEIRKAFLKGRIEKRVFNDENLPLNDKYHILSASVLDEDVVPILEIDGVRTGIFFNWPHDVWRGVIMDMMETRGRIDMALGIRGNGRLSLRANPGVNAGEISARYFGGGGHPGAAGGEIRDSRLRDLAHAVSAIRKTLEAVAEK
jgi:hypothetical protein